MDVTTIERLFYTLWLGVFVIAVIHRFSIIVSGILLRAFVARVAGVRNSIRGVAPYKIKNTRLSYYSEVRSK